MRFLLTICLTLGFVLFVFPQLLYALAVMFGKIFAFRVAYRPFLIASLALVGFLVCASAYGYFIGRKGLEVRRVSVGFESLPPAFEGYRIVQLSDLHLDGLRGDSAYLERIVDSVAALRPDMICFTGDLVSLRAEELDPYADILARLQAPDGVYSVLGNHDYMPYHAYENDSLRLKAVQALVERQRAMGWNVLLNESSIVCRGGDSIAVVGVENQSCGVHSVVRRGRLDDAQKGVEGMFRILLSHDPSHWRAEVLPQTDIPLTLSGHTHAMQLRIGRFTPAVWAYPECDGLYTDNGRCLYVNIGIGGTLPLRLGATPEITLLQLHRR